MISKIIHKLWKSEGQEEFYTPKDMAVAFKLTYRHLEVGTLSLINGQWAFRYSEAFKNQTNIKPLPDFPDVNKIYASGELYPFFNHRIPGLGQTKVQEIIREEKIDARNEASLLKRFGKQTISNPFVLQAV